MYTLEQAASMGGKERAKKLSPERRKEIAITASNAASLARKDRASQDFLTKLKRDEYLAAEAWNEIETHFYRLCKLNGWDETKAKMQELLSKPF